MFQRLPIANALVKTGKTHEKLLKEIREVIYFLYQGKNY